MIVDNVKMISRWPDKGMLVPISSSTRAVGGAVCNSGIDLKTLDPEIEVKALGRVGDDDAGDFVVSTLEAKGLDCSLVARAKGVPTSFTDVMTVESTGERTFFNMHGADSALTPDDVDASKLGCDIFHFGYLLLLDGMDAADEEYGTKAARLLAKVRAAGVKTSIDIVSEQSERFARVVRPALKHCDYVVINEVEGALATGVPADDMRGICEGLFELGVGERVVVHRPETGVSMGRDGDYVQVPSLDLPDGWIKGSVGAGDAFCAGVLYALLKGFDAEHALRLASCAAAMNLSSPDSVGGARSLAETMALESRFPRRSV
jgi:sugar/nucleoside kinase (ribokinase family)